MRGLEKNYMKRGHIDKLTSRLLERHQMSSQQCAREAKEKGF